LDCATLKKKGGWDMKEEYWKAIVECDESYDGDFYYGVLTTGIFCRPSCKSRTPKKDNVRIYKNITDAHNEGLRPCKRCRPELVTSYSTSEQLVEKVNKLISISYANDLTLHEIARRTFVSPFYLQRVFKQKTQMSPKQYLILKRVEAAKTLLEKTSLSITQIALRVGFKNSSHFSSVFTKEVGFPPSKYRNIHSNG
jgi:AraC family transcriptional regulator of adaptative response / methylphosphotriester-DNA alkyltransferase methyltransferase